jgi:hypothetical protein
MPAKYVPADSKGQKSDFRVAQAIAEAAQRRTMKSVASKTADQLDSQALHRCANDWSGSAAASSMRFVPSRWHAGQELRFPRNDGNAL